jgi:hypothetical protein
MGVYVPAAATVLADFMAQLLHGLHAFGWFKPSDFTFMVDSLDLPATPAATADFDSADIVALSRDELPAEVNPTVFDVDVAWRRNFTLQTDIAAGAAAEIRTFNSLPHRQARRTDAALQSRNRKAVAFHIDSPLSKPLIAETQAANALAENVLNLLSGDRKQYRLEVTLRGAPLTEPQEITLNHPRLSGGANIAGHVIGYSFDSTRATVELIVVT